jgi:hypothetical protein
MLDLVEYCLYRSTVIYDHDYFYMQLCFSFFYIVVFFPYIKNQKQPGRYYVGDRVLNFPFLLDLLKSKNLNHPSRRGPPQNAVASI